MRRILAEEKRWIGERRFLHALNFCMLLPGPEAQQLATYIGWLLHGTRGGLVAGGLFVLPGAITILLLSWIYVWLVKVPAIEGFFFGLKAAVVVVVAEAVLRIGRRALGHPARVLLAALSFVALFALHIPFPYVVLTAGVVGILAAHMGSGAFAALPGHTHASTSAGQDSRRSVLPDDAAPATSSPQARRTVRILVIGLSLWLGPVLALVVALGPASTLAAIGIFFSKMAVVTFGGA